MQWSNEPALHLHSVVTHALSLTVCWALHTQCLHDWKTRSSLYRLLLCRNHQQYACIKCIYHCLCTAFMHTMLALDVLAALRKMYSDRGKHACIKCVYCSMQMCLLPGARLATIQGQWWQWCRQKKQEALAQYVCIAVTI